MAELKEESSLISPFPTLLIPICLQDSVSTLELNINAENKLNLSLTLRAL